MRRFVLRLTARACGNESRVITFYELSESVNDLSILSMFYPVDVTALPGYKIRLRYSDGIVGEVDLSELVGKGVFKIWEDYRIFEGVAIGEGGRIMWGDAIDMCPDALYLRLTGKTPEQVFPNVSEMSVNA